MIYPTGRRPVGWLVNRGIFARGSQHIHAHDILFQSLYMYAMTNIDAPLFYTYIYSLLSAPTLSHCIPGGRKGVSKTFADSPQVPSMSYFEID